jgi:prepilin-type processing-associated H-X9-DG protein
MLTSELLVGQTNNGTGDLRGFSWWSWCTQFTTWLAPNSTLPDNIQSNCNYPFSTNPPCVLATSSFTMYIGARSRHPGGLNAGMADGSVRFFKNSISLPIWQAVSTTQGGEVVSSDSY